METELKIEFTSREDMDRLWTDPGFASFVIPASEKLEQFETVYLDTEDSILRRNGASLRVRAVEDNGFIHTVKSKVDEKSGLHQRYEWNRETEDSEFSAEAFREQAISNGDPDTILSEILDSVEGEKLSELFKTVFTRRSFLAGFGDSLMEIAIDYGVLQAGNREETICEMEIELKEGDARDVISLGDEILANTSAKLDSRSKYSRGVTLLAAAE